MGRPPAYLFVVRHGLRLDAADKQWHLSSPTPYDPPLTYIGWQQAKSLGARIGSLIRDKVNEEEAAQKLATDVPGGRKRKRYKVVLHSSPFLRCVQTSIAISAGLAQDPTPFGSSSSTERPPPSPPILSPRSRPTIIPDRRDSASPSPRSPPIRRSVLRLDACLGEWLSPGYFELITPPPESVMMLASAKADLLRREDYTSYPNFSGHVHSNSQGHLWSPSDRPGGSISTPPNKTSDPSDALASSLQRSGSISSQGGQSWRSSTLSPGEPDGYVSPVPHYAVSNNNTIPPGFAAHARDACVDIDYQWDSMRHPLDWGDGGTFPEEWASMHRRFRKGLQHLVDWYSTTENPTDMVTKTAPRFARRDSVHPIDDMPDEDEDVETEPIVILVSHGAGCNALIGAITHQPVLMDVAMASLTMAVRKPAKDEAGAPKSPQGVQSPGWASPERRKDTIPVYQLYDLEIFASTDHLRSVAPSPAVSRTPSVAGAVNNVRGRYSNSFSSSLNNFSFNDGAASRASSANAALSSLRRGEGSAFATSKLALNMTNGDERGGGVTSSGFHGGGITVGSGMISFTKPSSGLARTPSIGLWSPISVRGDGAFEDDEDDEDDMLLNFSHERETPTVKTPTATVPRLNSDEDQQKTPVAPPATTNGNAGKPPRDMLLSPIDLSESANDDYFPTFPDSDGSGLWGGGPRPPDDADRLRDVSSAKRRWTVTERS
ncbi:hypothetical protein B0T25DRAFT_210715 [Lasiosphaeria hispida]|uniref:Phosphoglycerate mutase family protein n=1 Tax=Lasiosphaeria hispida TaxID=260671 RepID=A0AAJ0HJA6_9PEZI|nr:hypothetical protein B0T25DRAFT_210715 [Lasiosphaeria hispida]